MVGSSRFALPVTAILTFLLAAGCGDDGPRLSNPPPAPGPMPEFSLLDVNPSSSTSGQQVSPRRYLQRVSAWYFGYAT